MDIKLILEMMAIVKDEPTKNEEVNFAFGSNKLPITFKQKLAKLRRQWKRK